MSTRIMNTSRMAAAAALTIGLAITDLPIRAQGQAAPPAQGQGTPGQPGGRANTPPPDPTKPHKLEITTGTTARYKVREQLAGISFPSDAVGTTSAATGRSSSSRTARSTPPSRS